jgi:hypothetical protein
MVRAPSIFVMTVMTVITPVRTYIFLLFLNFMEPKHLSTTELGPKRGGRKPKRTFENLAKAREVLERDSLRTTIEPVVAAAAPVGAAAAPSPTAPTLRPRQEGIHYRHPSNRGLPYSQLVGTTSRALEYDVLKVWQAIDERYSRYITHPRCSLSDKALPAAPISS